MGFTRGTVQKHGNRFFVQLYWKGTIEKFWSVLIQGQWHPIKHYENGKKLLAAIQEDIDRDPEAFDPRTFRPSNPLSLGEYYKTWLVQCDAGKKCKRDYKTCIVNYAIPYFGADKDIRKFRKAELVLYQQFLKNKLEEKGAYNKLGALKTMVRWAFSNEEIKRVPPFPKMSMPKPSEIEYLTMEQQELVLSHVPTRDVYIFRFAMEYGPRIGEVRAIKKDAVKNGKVYIKRAFSDNDLNEKTKTGEVGELELTPYAKEILDNLPKHTGPFLFVREDGKPYTNKNLNKVWHEACGKAGIRIKLYNAVRHSLGCQLLDEGKDESFVQAVLRHKTSEMTKRYAKRTSKRIGQVLSMRRPGYQMPHQQGMENCGSVAVENNNVIADNN